MSLILKTAIIDHHDSFTHNILRWLEADKNFTVSIFSYPFLLVEISSFDLLILSPGPKSPQDYPESINLLKIPNRTFPIFGICLGMQMMAETVETYTPVQHGKTDLLSIQQKHPLFEGIDIIKIARYHSLVCKKFSDDFQILARSKENFPMAVFSSVKKCLGVQFHPESFMTDQADLLRKNLYRWASTC